MHTPRKSTRVATPRKLGAALAMGALLLTACGADDDSSETSNANAPEEIAASADMLGAFGPACSAVPTDGEGSFAGMADDTAATAASANPLLTTLVAAVTQAGLVDTLNSDGPFTIFAPVDDAFAAIDPDVLDAVLADQDLLTSVLTYHVIGGTSLDADGLAGAGTSATVEGDTLTFGPDGTTVDDVDVICSNVPVANGTVHIIDQVLLPQVALDAIASMGAMDDQMDDAMSDDAMDDDAMDDQQSADMLGASGPACGAVPTEGEGSFAGMADDTAATAASANPLLSTLVTAVVQADLVDTLNSDGPFTIFAPVNDAFAALPPQDLEAVLADPGLLTDILTFHVIVGESLDADALVAAGSAEAVNGGELTFAASGETFTVNGATTICQNVPTANATVHIIDSVLLPST